MTTIDNYIVPIFSRSANEASWVGSGFLINGHLITAGHVLSRPQTYYTQVEGAVVELLPQSWRPQLIAADDKTDYDVAIYPLPHATSSFMLSNEEPQANDELEVMGWQRRNGVLQQVRTSCLVLGKGIEDGYFKLATVDRITHGISGSPIFRNGKVYGILTLGRDHYEMPDGLQTLPPHSRQLINTLEQNTCWAFRASHIMRFMK